MTFVKDLGGKLGYSSVYEMHQDMQDIEYQQLCRLAKGGVRIEYDTIRKLFKHSKMSHKEFLELLIKERPRAPKPERTGRTSLLKSK